MKNNNLRVRIAVTRAGIRYRDLAETLGITPVALSERYMHSEMSRAEQDRLVAAVKETKERLEKKGEDNDTARQNP